jgi:fatty acid desaturase
VSEHRIVNQLVLFVTYPLILMLSATYWHRSHVQIHHPAPNVVDVDDDCDLRPLFALNEQHAASRVPNVLHRVASRILPFLLPLNGFSMHMQCWQHVVGELRKPKRERQPFLFADLACMTLHLVLWLAVPMIWFSPGKVLGVYALRVGIMGFGLFAILAPGHFPAEARCLDKSLRGTNFYVRQTFASLNFRTSWLGRFLCSGLEYQIEHHLFPGIPHVHYRKVSPHVRAFCEQHGLPHRTLGWGEGIWKSYLVFLRPKPVLDHIATQSTELPSEVGIEVGVDLTPSSSSLPAASSCPPGVGHREAPVTSSLPPAL